MFHLTVDVCFPRVLACNTNPSSVGRSLSPHTALSRETPTPWIPGVVMAGRPEENTNRVYCRCSWTPTGRNGPECVHHVRHMSTFHKPDKYSCVTCKAALCSSCIGKPAHHHPKCCSCRRLNREQIIQAISHLDNINVCDDATQAKRFGFLFSGNNNNK